MNTKTIIWLLVGAVLAVLALYGVYLFRSRPTASGSPEVIAIAVEKPNIVVTGRKLEAVEIWGVPTGTEITEEDYALLGQASFSETAADGVERWVFPIPSPTLVTELFAKGLVGDHTEIGRKSLGVSGATDIYNLLWGSDETAPATTSPASSSPKTESATFQVGGTRTFGGLTLTLRSVEDSRCPAGVECIWMGDATISLGFEEGGGSGVTSLSINMHPEQSLSTSAGTYILRFISVTPAPTAGVAIPERDYRVKLSVAGPYRSSQ
jgi:hypothetical protein